MAHNVNYCRTPAQVDAAISPYYDGHLGFDLEWKPNYIAGQPQNPVALVQLATDRNIFLIQIARMRPYFPQCLVDILANPLIPKAGAGIQDDVKKLWIDCRVSVTSCVDLSLFARSVDCALFNERLGPYRDVPLVLPAPPDPPPSSAPTSEVSGEPSSSTSSSESPPPKAPPSPHDFRLFRGRYRDPIGLARLVKAYHNQELPKEKRITRSNWEAVLNSRQIDYAAADAKAGYTLYEHLLGLFFALPEDKRPKRKYYAFDCIQGELYLPRDPESREPLYNPTPTHPINNALAEPYSTLRVKWSVQNPEYCSGPMPPKEKKVKDGKEKGKDKDGESVAGEEKQEAEHEQTENSRSRRRRGPQGQDRSQRPNVPYPILNNVGSQSGRKKGGGRGSAV